MRNPYKTCRKRSAKPLTKTKAIRRKYCVEPIRKRELRSMLVKAFIESWNASKGYNNEKSIPY